MLVIASEIITYDPNYTYDNDDTVMDEEEDCGWGSEIEDIDADQVDDDDSSWKVRRAGIKVIEVII